MKPVGQRAKNLVLNVPMYYRAFGVRGICCFAFLRYSKSLKLWPMYFRGEKKPVWMRSGTTDVGVMREIFLDKEYDFGINIFPKVIVDAGSNIGLSSVYYALNFPDATIYSIEPEKSNFDVLEKNARSHRSIIPIRMALWSETKLLQIIDPGRGEHGFVTEDGLGSSGIDVMGSVEALSIPDLMKRFGIDFIDILKVDIEGAEKEVFENSGEWIAKVGLVVVEIHERFKEGCLRAFIDATRNMVTVFERGKLICKMNPDWEKSSFFQGKDSKAHQHVVSGTSKPLFTE